jgi:dihydropyrimidinase
MEGEATGRIIDIATMVGIPVHIFHVSCAETVQRIAAARRHGLSVTGETCPHYLFLTQDVYDAPGIAGTLPVCSPPIRDQSAQDALWQALSAGNLQVITTDHCPFTQAEKASGLQNYSQIPGGVPGIEMRFAALYSQGVRNGRLSLNQWVDLCCTTPARLVGLMKKGHIGIGYDADLVIFDPDKEKTLSTNTLHEQVDWTPYEGMNIQGWPSMTMSRGRVLVENDEFLGEPGCGRFVHR